MTAAIEGVSGQQHAPAALYHWERPGTHFTGGWVASGPVWTRENLASTGIRSRTLRSQSICRLSYRAHLLQSVSRPKFVCGIPKSNSEALLFSIDLLISAISSVMFKRHRKWDGKYQEYGGSFRGLLRGYTFQSVWWQTSEALWRAQWRWVWCHPV